MPDSVDKLFLDFQAALAGRYSLERELGRGGMGVVYLAREVRLDRLVAIKLLPPRLAAEPPLRERFLREARTAARLSHPHVVPIYAVDEAGDFVYYVMAFIDGATLAQRVASRGPLPPAEVARTVREVAWALAYAHAQGVVHRDVKPENILLETGTNRALVADFGIARLAHASGQTGVGELIGTPDFMSPEQAAGEAVDGRSDLYSLGVVAYYALSGRLPFTGPNAQAVLAQHLTRPPAPVATLSPTTPAKLAAAVDRCLKKNPTERFATGEALSEALADAIEARRDVPAPIRVFLRQTRGAAGGFVVWYLLFGPAGIGGFLVDLLSGGMGSMIELVTRGLGAGIVLTAPVLYTTARLRRLLKLGYQQGDLVAGIRTDLEQRREEAVYEYGVHATRGDRLLWIGAAVTGAASVGAALLASATSLVTLEGIAWGCGIGAGMMALIAAVRMSRRPSAKGSSKFWGGRIGRWLFRLAGWRLKAPPGVALGRPTELAIGGAAEALFAALPRDTRRALGDVPASVRRLEAEAQAARQRIEELERAIAQADEGAGPAALSQGRSRLADELRQARDKARARQEAIVAALETVRLQLLRLSADAGSLGGVTADLERALSLGAEADRLLEARDEAEAAAS